MGYRTLVTEEITITPPLTWAEIKDSRFLPGVSHDRDWPEVHLNVVTQTRDTAEGTLTVKTADAIVPAYDDEYKAYQIVKHVQEIVDAYPGHQWDGYLYGEGEEAGDMWRVMVRDGKAVKVTPQITWPD